MSDRRDRIKALFHAATELPPADRAAFLATACGTDAAVREEVERLLASDAAASGFLEAPALVPSALRVGMVGTTLGSYEIQALLGTGGMGEVYRARDRKLGRDVAIKVLPPIFAVDPERLARFEREARLLAALNHPHIGAIYGLEEAGGVRGLVLELIEGETLEEKLRHGSRLMADGLEARPPSAISHKPSGGLPIDEALAIARQIAEALDAAHEKGIIHRDLKPANVKITPDGVVKVLDFGLAKVLAGEGSGPDLSQSPTVTVGGTRDGMLLGTAAYMSPEQARGKAVDKRTDLWAFGCVVYELLTGRAAFGGETVSDTIAAILGREPDWDALPAATPPGLRRLLRRCLEKDVRRRLRDIGDVRSDLDDALAAPSATPVAREPRGRHDRLGWSLAAVLGLTLAVVAIRALVRSGADLDTAPRISRALRLTNTAAQEFGPAVSPDGKWVAYLSDARGRVDAWVQFLDSGATLNLTAATGLDLQGRASLGGLEISPDGAFIAFSARQNPSAPIFDTWVVPAPIGGVPRKFVEGRMAMRWSPDGQQIVCMRAGASLGDALWVGNGDGTNLREIVPLKGGRHIHWPAWSADGRYVYFIYSFITWHSEPSEIYRVRAAGGEPEPVVRSLRRAIFPVPMPGNKGLIYAGNPTSVDVGLWWQPPGNGEPQPLSTGVGEHAETRLSADGRHLVTSLLDLRQSLVAFPVRFDQKVEGRAITDGYTGDLEPASSPRGDRMVFTSSRSGNRNLWIAAADGSRPRPLTTENAIDEHPAFSADGQQIAFVSDRGGRRGIWVIGADGGAPRFIGAAVVLDTLTWSPDGKRILYAAPAGDIPQLATMSVADGRIERFPTPGAAHSPAWSPATNVIAYLEPTVPTPTVPSRTWVAFVDSEGRPLHANLPKPATPFQNGFVAWAPDGRRLAAVSANAIAPMFISIVEPDAPQPFRTLVTFPMPVRPRGVTWTSDGTGLLIGKQESTSDIVLFELSR